MTRFMWKILKYLLITAFSRRDPPGSEISDFPYPVCQFQTSWKIRLPGAVCPLWGSQQLCDRLHETEHLQADRSCSRTPGGRTAAAVSSAEGDNAGAEKAVGARGTAAGNGIGKDYPLLAHCLSESWVQYGDKAGYLNMAVQALEQIRGCCVRKVSSFLVTKTLWRGRAG